MIRHFLRDLRVQGTPEKERGIGACVVVHGKPSTAMGPNVVLAFMRGHVLDPACRRTRRHKRPDHGFEDGPEAIYCHQRAN